MIRFGKSPQPHTKNSKKPDNLEILTLLDNCTLIFKDDRIALRNMVKDGNQDLIIILNQYKRATNYKELCTELRKFLKKKGDKENNQEKLVAVCHSPTTNKCQKQIAPTLGSSQKKSCPDLWKPIEPSSPKTINLGKIKEMVNDVQLSEIILSDRFNDEKSKQTTIDISQQYFTQQPTYIRTSERESKTIQQSSQPQSQQISQQNSLNQQDVIPDDDDNLPSESSNESILEQITNPPLIQNQNVTNDIKPTQLFQSGHSSYLQINVAQSYLQPSQQYHSQQSQQSQESQSQIQQGQDIIISDKQKTYSFFNYQNYQTYAQPEYQHLFTNWPSLLHKLDKPDYVSTQKSPIFLKTTPEQIFTMLFPNSAFVKINYFNFLNVLKGKINEDLDQLFRQLDQDMDDWINYRETGLLLQGICLCVEQPKNCVKVIFETLKQQNQQTNILQYSDLQNFEKKTDFEFARQLMQEIDTTNKGFLTYWDLYMHREIYLMEKLCQIVQSLTGNNHTH